METPPVNHRYYGWRESAKFVVQLKGIVRDVDSQMRRVSLLENTIEEAALPTLLAGCNAEISAVQAARVLVKYLQSVNRG